MITVGPLVLVREKELQEKLARARAHGETQALAKFIQIEPGGEIKLDIQKLGESAIQGAAFTAGLIVAGRLAKLW